MNLLDLYNTASFAFDRSNGYGSNIPAEIMQVVIKVKVIGTAGPIPVVPVKFISEGIDWDKGKLIIVPEVDLRIAEKDEISEVKEKYEELAMKQSEISSLKTKNEKLKEQVEKLKIKLDKLNKNV